VQWRVVDALWGGKYEYISCTGTTFDPTELLDTEALEQTKNVAVHVESDELIPDDGAGADVSKYNAEEHARTDEEIKARKFHSSHNPDAATRLAPMFTSCEGKVKEFRTALASKVATTVEIDLEAASSSDDDDEEKCVAAPAVKVLPTKKPEPEKRLFATPEAAAAQAAYVAEIEAKAKADYRLRVAEAEHKKNVREATEFLKMESKVAEFKAGLKRSKEEKTAPAAAAAAAPTKKRKTIVVADSDETETEADTNEKEEPALKKRVERNIQKIAFSGTVAFIEGTNDPCVVMDGDDGKLSPPIIAPKDSPIITAQLCGLDDGDRVHVIVQKWQKNECVIVNSVVVFEPQSTYMTLPYHPKKQSVLLSNGKYIPVIARGDQTKAVLGSIAGNALRNVQFSVSKFLPTFMIVVDATVL